jgi:uncharacterized oligopeptide transporter (OPT) family protein
MFWKIGAERFDDMTLGLSPALLGATLLVGIGGGAVGAAYLLGLHLLQHVLAPEQFGAAAEFAVLAGVGID